MRSTGKLLGSGRSADVYEIDEAWVLRRDRAGWGDATAEAAVMEHVRGHGFPAPGVRLATRTDLVMERLSGPTMLEAFGTGRLGHQECGLTLARLLRALHAVPARISADPAVRVLHLDLHPDNVMLTPDGPRVIDWANTEEGPPGLDWGMSAVILAQVAVSDAPYAKAAHDTLTAMLTDGTPGITDAGLTEARERREANPTMSETEIRLLGEAEELVRGISAPGL
ncbi:aminoglycoside phosphotransferase family protein [Streptomyces sp. NPDC050535]|uniref:aminoglycoside phosphotransferase family protein n=1 Tax=Streptomyces sp. NPDC050535 TaxID=3365626 RepID=UPI0037A6D003